MVDELIMPISSSTAQRSRKLDDLKRLMHDKHCSKIYNHGKVQSIQPLLERHFTASNPTSINYESPLSSKLNNLDIIQSPILLERSSSNNFEGEDNLTIFSEFPEISNEHCNELKTISVICSSSPDSFSGKKLKETSNILEFQEIDVVSQQNVCSDLQTSIPALLNSHLSENCLPVSQISNLGTQNLQFVGGENVCKIKDMIFSIPHTDQMIHCRIHRIKEGMGGMNIFPTYFMYLESKEKSENVFLLAARRRKKSKLCNYVITTNQYDLSRDSNGYSAKLRSNFLGTEFSIFSAGNGFKSSAICSEFAFIRYEKNIMGIRGPRRMIVLIPSVVSDEPYMFHELDHSNSLEDEYQSTSGKVEILENKIPDWNPDSQTYMLNFNGRVTQASVKNFQLVSIDGNTVMQFGKIDQNIFNLDFSFPLSPLQAFGIALSSFERKFACE